MKRLFAICLAFSLSLALCACGSSNARPSNAPPALSPAQDDVAARTAAPEVPDAIDTQAEAYFDLFQSDSGLAPLVCLATEGGDGSFSDDQLAAYSIQALASRGEYDYEAGLSKETLDAFTTAHFGRAIQNYDNSMSCTLPNGKITSTGWSFDCSVFLVLDGEAAEDQDGTVTARFRCYILSDSLWLDEELPAEALANAKEYLLAGQDADFPAPVYIELTFQPQLQASGETVLLYRSLKLLA